MHVDVMQQMTVIWVERVERFSYISSVVPGRQQRKYGESKMKKKTCNFTKS